MTAPAESIDRAADALISPHRRWRVFRGNLRALTTYDEELRSLTLKLRRGQLDKIRALKRLRGGGLDHGLEGDAITTMMFERVCDAIADGDFELLGGSEEVAQRMFRNFMRQYLLEPH